MSNVILVEINGSTIRVNTLLETFHFKSEPGRKTDETSITNYRSVMIFKNSFSTIVAICMMYLLQLFTNWYERTFGIHTA
jgi:chorismate-pyruvate lyase